jgi:hypothetical protein
MWNKLCFFLSLRWLGFIPIEVIFQAGFLMFSWVIVGFLIYLTYLQWPEAVFIGKIIRVIIVVVTFWILMATFFNFIREDQG